MQIHHYKHLQSEGFSRIQISQLENWGVKSISFGEARAMGFYKRVFNADRICGLWLPFAGNYGQLRCDCGNVKYLSPPGSKVQPWFPDGLVPAAITEGFKDAAIATLSGGIPTGAIAGVGHYKCLPQGQGQTIVFDSDAHTNQHVISSLVKAAQWTGGKVAIVPIDCGHRAGLCEFLRGQQSPNRAYQALLDSALQPQEFLWQLPQYWDRLPGEKRSSLFKALVSLYQQCLPGESIERFIKHLDGFAPPDNLTPCLAPSLSSRNSLNMSLVGTIPLEICLSRQNQDLLQNGADNYRVPSGFKLAADLVGVADILDRLGLSYWQSPRLLLIEYGRKSGLRESQINSIWKSATSQARRPAVPEEKIRDRVSYYLRFRSG